MPIAEAIGTAMGNAFGEVQKYVTEDFVDQMVDGLSKTFTSERKTKLSDADKEVQVSAAVYGNQDIRKSVMVNDPCNSASDAVNARKSGIDQSTLVSELSKNYKLLTEPKTNEVRKIMMSLNGNPVHLSSLIDYQQPLTTEHLKSLGLQIDLVTGTPDFIYPHNEKNLDSLSVDGLQDIANSMSGLFIRQFSKWILTNSATEQVVIEGETRIQSIERRVNTLVDENGTWKSDVLVGLADSVPILKELVLLLSMQNEIKYLTYLEKEKALILKALKLNTLLEKDYA